MSKKAFASSADLDEKQQTLEVLADGVYALTAEGDPNVGAIEGEDFVVCFEALATPVAAGEWLAKLREHRSEEHTSELQPQSKLVCRLLLEKKNQTRVVRHVLGDR